jgi:hypothetical protein
MFYSGVLYMQLWEMPVEMVWDPTPASIWGNEIITCSVEGTPIRRQETIRVTKNAMQLESPPRRSGYTPITTAYQY